MIILKNTKPFWQPMKGGKVNLHNYLLRSFLEKYGFGQFATVKDRTSTKTLFHNDAGILKVHDQVTIKSKFEGKAINYKKDGTPFIMYWRVLPIKVAKKVKLWVAIQREGSAII